MDASLRSRAEQLAGEIASQAETADDLNGLMRLMMKAGLERMLNSEMDVHLGARGVPAGDSTSEDADSGTWFWSQADVESPQWSQPQNGVGRSG